MVDPKGKGPRGSVAMPANESGAVCWDENIPMGGTAKTGGYTTIDGKKANGNSPPMASSGLGFEGTKNMVTDGADLRAGYRPLAKPDRGKAGDPVFEAGPKPKYT